MKPTTTLPIIAALVLLALHSAPAQVPNILNYQGRVTVGGTNLTTNAALFKFALVSEGINANYPAELNPPLIQGGQVTFVGLENGQGGLGYVTPPQVTISDTTGSGAVVEAVLSGSSVASFNVINPGSNYSQNATVSIEPPPPSYTYSTYWNNDGATSGNGGEPATAVTVPVAQGLYSALLGDTTLVNMAAIPASVFTNGNVNLRVWFSPGGAEPFVALTPDQRLGASGYALRAASVDVPGENNTVAGYYATIGGGESSIAAGNWATVAGGAANTASGVNSAIGGGYGHLASSNSATVAGGAVNKALNDYAAVGGGSLNSASGLYSVVAGGRSNQATASYAAIGGGRENIASFDYATVAGGQGHRADGQHSSVGGGGSNTATGAYATIPGGQDNAATNYCFAAGYGAKATNVGSFVWSGDVAEQTSSWGNGTFTVRAEGGVRFYTANGTGTGPRVAAGGTDFISSSDSNLKTKVTAVDPRAILAKLSQLPVTEWEYKHNPNRRYIGPMAQDFHAAFGLGEDDKGIGTLDSDGVMYAAIQGLVEELHDRDKTIDELKAWSMEQGARSRAEVDELKAKLQAVEQRLNSLPPVP